MHEQDKNIYPSDSASDKVSAPERISRKKVRIITSLCIVLLILLNIFALGYSVVSSKLDMIDYQSPEDWVVATYSDLASDSDLDELDPVDEDAEVILPEEEIFKDKNVVNILLLGTDERKDKLSENARADAILIVSLNKSADTIKLVSLERGMAVKMPNGKIDLLTHAFRYGGPKWMISCVRTHFNLDVEKYVRVNFDVFEKLVDAVGGVDIELTETEAAALNHEVTTNTFWLSRRVNEGMNHLNGYEALQYCRLRYTDSDWQRIVRQRNTISAIMKQCKSLSIGELNDAVDTILPMIQTNLEKKEILSLMASMPQFLNSEMEDMTIPVSGTYTKLSRVDFVENSRILHEFFYGE